MRRRLISLLLTLSLVVGCLSGIPVLADGDTEELFVGQAKTVTFTEDDVDRWGECESKQFVFTPGSSGKYGFLVDKLFHAWCSEASLSNEISANGKTCYWYWLDAGEEYSVNINLNTDSVSSYPYAGEVTVITGDSTKVYNAHVTVNAKEYWNYCDDRESYGGGEGNEKWKAYSLSQGDDVTLQTEFDAEPVGASLRFQWYRTDGFYVPWYATPSNYEDDLIEIPGANNSALTVNNISRSGLYVCRIYTGTGDYEFTDVGANLIIDTFDMAGWWGYMDGSAIAIADDYGEPATLVFTTFAKSDPAVTLHYVIYRLGDNWEEIEVDRGTVIAGNDITYQVPEVTDSCTYLCRVSDDFGRVVDQEVNASYSTELTAPSGTKFTVGSQGRTYTLSVAVNGRTDGFECEWYRVDEWDEERLPQFDNQSTITTEILDLDSVPESLNGITLYRCKVGDDEINYRFFRDDVFEVSSKGDTSYWIEYNESCVLEVDVFVSTDVSYKWYMIDPETEESILLNGETGSSITVTWQQAHDNADKWNSSRYECKVTDGRKSETIEFSVVPLWTFKVIPISEFSYSFGSDTVYGYEGETVELKANVEPKPGLTSTFTFQWYRGDLAIPGETSSSFTTPNLIDGWTTGVYWCKISDGRCEGSYYAEVGLKERKKDFVVSTDSWLVVDAGESVEIEYSVQAGDEYWTAELLDNDGNIVDCTSRRYYGSSDSSFEISDGIQDTQRFFIRVTSSCGETISKVITVRVRNSSVRIRTACIQTDEYSSCYFKKESSSDSIIMSQDATYYYAGETVVFVPKCINLGYILDEIDVTNDSTGAVVAFVSNGDGSYSFDMPDNDVTISVTSKPVPDGGSYPILLEQGKNGNAFLSSDEACEGALITVYTTPDEGYELDKILVMDTNGTMLNTDANNTFTMPCTSVLVKAFFKPIAEAPIQTGWIKEEGVWHYYNEAGVKQSGWINIDGIYYYLDPANNDGMATGWLEIGNKWYHFKNDGAMTKGWYSAGSSWWYFDGSGAMVTSWKKIDNKWYFFDRSSGVMMTGGWKKIDDVWYYFRDSGNIATGWEQINGKYYYFNNNGEMQTGWIKDNNKWYYMNPQGDMKQNSWLNDGGKWYYFVESGAMAAGTSLTINGVVYRFAANGVCENPNGDPQNGWVKIDGVYYYYNGGEAVTGWQKIAKKWYYLDPDNGGAMWTGWLEDGGYTYYMDNSGAMVANRTITIDGTEYTFDASGHLK